MFISFLILLLCICIVERSNLLNICNCQIMKICCLHSFKLNLIHDSIFFVVHSQDSHSFDHQNEKRHWHSYYSLVLLSVRYFCCCYYLFFECVFKTVFVCIIMVELIWWCDYFVYTEEMIIYIVINEVILRLRKWVSGKWHIHEKKNKQQKCEHKVIFSSCLWIANQF